MNKPLLVQENPIYAQNAVAILPTKQKPNKNILHCDLNNFYASVECLENENFRNKPLVVCGCVEERKGVVLAKNYIAKSFGIKTGQTLWEAKKLCPFLISTNARFDRYIYYSNLVRQVFLEYTDLVEPFSIDEAWLDVTHSKVFGDPLKIAVNIKNKIKKEIGLTVSLGVSFNKTISKLGSDMKKPDAITHITHENFKKLVWCQPVENLLMVGPRTLFKLKKIGIVTIGHLANLPLNFLQKKFGIIGVYLSEYANGLENKPVKQFGNPEKVKHIGNSTTCYKDLHHNFEVREVFTQLSQKLAERLFVLNLPPIKHLCVYVKNNLLQTQVKRIVLTKPIFASNDILNESFNLFKSFYLWQNPIRALGINLGGFIKNENQLSFFDTPQKQQSVNCLCGNTLSKTIAQKNLEKTTIDINKKFGENTLFKGSCLFDKKLSLKGSMHSIHPISFLK